MPLQATYQPTILSTPLQFGLLIDPPNRQTEMTVSEAVIPGSTDVVLDMIGKPTTKIRGKARINGYQAFKTFEGAVGTMGTLVYGEELSGIQVAFIGINRQWVNPQSDIHICDIEFWILPTNIVLSGF